MSENGQVRQPPLIVTIGVNQATGDVSHVHNAGNARGYSVLIEALRLVEDGLRRDMMTVAERQAEAEPDPLAEE